MPVLSTDFFYLFSGSLKILDMMIRCSKVRNIYTVQFGVGQKREC